MDESIRAKYAKDILDNPVFTEALEQIQAGINRDMDVCNDESDALKLVQLRQATNRIIQYMISTAESTKITEFNALQRQKKVV